MKTDSLFGRGSLTSHGGNGLSGTINSQAYGKFSTVLLTFIEMGFFLRHFYSKCMNFCG